MNFLDIAKNRYTTKVYNADKKISDDKIQQLQQILMLSPSSINSQPWKFTFVSDENVKRKLAEASSFNEPKVLAASHLVVFSVIDNIAKFEEQINKNLPAGAVGYYNQNVKPLTEPEIKSWLQHQVYLSLGFFLGACASLEIDSTSMEGINNSEYDKILPIEGYKTLFSVAIGYRDASDSNQPSITPKNRLKSEDIIKMI